MTTMSFFRKLNRSEQNLLQLFPLLLLGLYLMLFTLSPGSALAQTTVTGAFTAAAQTIENAIKTVSGACVAVLIMGGLFCFMWSGLSDGIRRRALAIIGGATVGAIGVFLLATPLSQFLVTTFNTGA
jgi:hypothetical protein